MNRIVNSRFAAAVTLLLILVGCSAIQAQTTAFTYQGKLNDAGNPANGTYDLQFKLFDALAGGNQIGGAVVRDDVAVANGIFTVTLDFGAGAFPGANRWLEIGVRPGVSTGSFTTLTPLQPITSTPYAVRSLNASSADTVTVNGVPPGSGNYIQNTSTPQADSQFNISGNGTAAGTLSANVVNANTQYNIAGDRILSNQGTSNLFAGVGAGLDNTTGNNNAFVGWTAGTHNIGGSDNAFFGGQAGVSNTTGSVNAFFGRNAGFLNTTGTGNSAIGWRANVGSTLNNATAVGAFAQADQSNSLVLGSIAGVNVATASVNVGIGTTTPQATLDVKGTGVFRPGGAGEEVSFGTPNGETGIVIKGPSNRADIRFNGSTLKLVAGLGSGPPSDANGLVVNTNGNVGIGTASPSEKLSVSGNLFISGRGEFGSFLKLVQIDSGLGTGSVHLCRNAALVIAVCDSSSLRYKQSIASFGGGLDLVRRLRPIRFTWKTDGSRDLGLGAEDVAKVEPLLTFKNAKGEIEGVRYDRLNVVLINAIKEQQAQIESQKRRIDQQNAITKKQQAELDALRALVCLHHRRAAVCKAQNSVAVGRSAAINR